MSEEKAFTKFRKSIPLLIPLDGIIPHDLIEELAVLFPEEVSDIPYKWKGHQSGLVWKHNAREAIDYLRVGRIIEKFDGKWYLYGYTPNEVDHFTSEPFLEESNKDLSREELVAALRKVTPKSDKWINIQDRKLMRDSDTIWKLKLLRGFKCQICGTAIATNKGGSYIEAAHIIAKRSSGPETPDNILILCPNHHKEFDYGIREILIHTNEFISFKLNGKEYRIDISLK